MAFKIKITGNLEKKIKRLQGALISEFQKEVGDEMRSQIIDYIGTKNRSPVYGFGKYQKYTAAYAKKKGVGRGKVDMKVSGKMLNSLKTRATRTGFTLWFSSGLAKYHDLPGLARVLRRLLPSLPGEKFVPTLDKVLTKASRNATNRALRKVRLK